MDMPSAERPPVVYNPYNPPLTEELEMTDMTVSAGGASGPQGSFLAQFAATVKKNMLQKWSDKISTLLELLLPLVFVVGLVGIWMSSEPSTHEAEGFVDFSEPMIDLTGIQTLFCSNATGGVPGYPACSSIPALFRSPELVCAKATQFELCVNGTLGIQIVYHWLGDWSNAKPIPSLNDMIHFMWMASAVIPSAITDDAARLPHNGPGRIGKLHFIATTNATRAGVTLATRYFDGQTNGLFSRYVLGRTFLTEADADSHTTAVATEGTTWGMVTLNKLTVDEFDFTLHFNRSAVPWTRVVQDRFASGGIGRGDFKLYYASGFLSLQQSLNEFYYAAFKGVTPPNPATGAPMPFIWWREDVFLATAGDLAPLMIVLSFLYSFSQQTKRIVEEKEKRMREAMLIMGLGTGSFYASWIVTYAMLYFFTSIFVTILLKVTFLPQANPFIIFFLYYFFCLSCITLSGAVSALFSKSRLAATIAPLLFFVFSMPFFIIGDSTPRGTAVGLSILSPSAFSIGAHLLFRYETANGIGSKQFADPNDTLNMAAVYFFLIFDTLLYFVLALYFDSVMPSEWGTREHPLFCFLRLSRLCSKKPSGSVFADGRDPNGAYEPEPRVQPSVVIRGLRKEFQRGKERLVAVNDLTLNLYEGQIAVILGHNGAGKTTAINLMTGMLEPTAGDCIVYGKSIRTEMSAIRQEIGFCPQHNILWPELTCRAHLEFFGKLKGLSGSALDESVIEMLKAVDLLDKMDYPSQNLSGGQKRKLSVAIAFIGGSRVVFLDEPTAGMDVSARRFTWDLIRRMSVGRTIILTTHYMDEADLLGNTIAIMSKGRLKCKGSSLFLKSRLGVGYNLTLAVEQNANPEQISRIVQGPIPSAETLSSGSGELSFRLPMSEVPHFPEVLAQLEQHGADLGVRSFGISVTTLEEVFLTIAAHETHDAQVVVTPTSGSPATPEPLSISGVDPHAWANHRSAESGFVRQFTSLVAKRFHNIKRDRRTQCFQIVLPVVCILFAMLLTVILVVPDTPKLSLVPSAYEEQLEVVYSNCPEWSAANTFVPLITPHSVNTSDAAVFSKYLQDYYRAHSLLRTTAFYCNESTGGRPFLFFNASRGIHSAPEALQLYYNSFARATGVATDLAVSTKPLPLSDREHKFVEAIQTLIVGIFIMIPFTFVPSTFVSWIVKERECKAKHLQTISGMKFTAYWTANFVFDIASFIVTEFLAIIVFLIFNRKEYIGGGEQFGAVFLLFFVYGLSGVVGSYLASFAFDNHGSAQNVVMLVNFICGFLLVLMNYILIDIDSTKDAGKVLRFIWRLVPSYCLGDGIINLAGLSLSASLGEAAKPFDMDVIGWDLVYMAIEFPIFALLTLIIDHPSRQKRAQQLFHQPDVLPPPIENEDADVTTERMQVETGMRSGDLVQVKHLCKVYSTSKGPKVAVKNLSFGVKPGEVFGFLGTNGAGKTTAMSILCGEQLPTHGRGWICGHDVVDDATAARFAVGYCPQFDALLDLLTAEEHLRLYAGLRGLSQQAIDDVVQSLILAAGLEAHRKTLASNMSGGNRRKLSVAIALVGAPQVVFLDEPSAGMDPLARRGLWDVVETVAARCSVVLTTHHLEEVEALAHRAGIMVNGELRCIGTLQQLKHKFGSGFEMSVRVKSEQDVQPLREFMEARFPTAKEQEFRQLKFTFALDPETKLSETFRSVESSKDQLGITDYSVSQTSLEQVFLRIGGDATEEE